MLEGVHHAFGRTVAMGAARNKLHRRYLAWIAIPGNAPPRHCLRPEGASGVDALKIHIHADIEQAGAGSAAVLLLGIGERVRDDALAAELEFLEVGGGRRGIAPERASIVPATGDDFGSRP